MNRNANILSIIIVILLLALPVWAAEDADQGAELAKKLSNPIADLVSVPLENRWDFGIGSENAMRYTLNIQPVIPFSIGKGWNLVTRTIVPIIYAEASEKGLDDREGLGDILQSFFFCPKAPTSNGWIWGVGPVIYYPSGTDNLSADKWAAGPTAIFLKQDSGWTYGLLAYHTWTFADRDEVKPDVTATFLQPIFSYTTKSFTTFGIVTESTYDWEAEKWTVPITISAAQLLKIGGIPLQFKAGWRVYADRPDGGPNWGLTFNVTFMFPK